MVDRLRNDPGLALVLLAIVIATALYAPTLGRGLVGYDDTYMIADNWIVRHPSWSSVHTIMFDLDSPRRYTLSPEYLPVRDLSIMLDVAVWRDWYPGFHLTNLALYLAAIALWFSALAGFGIDRRVAGLAMLIWAVHPSHAESVAWLAERKGLLAAVFSGAAALAYARYRSGARTGWLVMAMAAAVLAVWSKAPAAFALASLAALEVVLPAGRQSLRRALTGLAAIGVVAGAAFVPVLYLASMSSVVGTDGHAPAGRLAMIVGVHGVDVKLAMMAVRNAVSYPIAIDGPSLVEIIVGVVGLVVAVGVAVIPRRWRASAPAPLRAASVLWLVGLLPASHVILPLQMIVVADRYLLLPTLGIALAFAIGSSYIANARVRNALVGVIVLAAALRTLDAQANWRDARTLWQRAVESSPADGEAWSAYAEALSDGGQWAEAAEVASRGLKHSRDPRLLHRKALLLLANGNRTQGVVAMREAALAGEPRAMSNVALLLLADGAHDEALSWARAGAAAMPMYVPANRTLGKVALATGHPADARTAFERAYELDPLTCVNRFNLALALIALEQAGEARGHLEACRDDAAVGAQVRSVLDGLPR